MSDTGSILNETKKVLGNPEGYDAFDADIIMHINSTFAVLNQLGVGPKTTFQITGTEEIWSEFTNDPDFAMVKSYVWMCVRLLFDPPQYSFAVTLLEKSKEQMEWRMNVIAEGKTHG